VAKVFLLRAVYISDERWLPRFRAKLGGDLDPSLPWLEWRKKANKAYIRTQVGIVYSDFPVLQRDTGLKEAVADVADALQGLIRATRNLPPPNTTPPETPSVPVLPVPQLPPPPFTVIELSRDFLANGHEARVKVAQQQLNGDWAEPMVLWAIYVLYQAPLSWVEMGARRVIYVVDDIRSGPIFVYQEHAYTGDLTAPPTDLDHLALPAYQTHLVSAPADGSCVYHAARTYYPRLPSVPVLREAVATFLAGRPRSGGDRLSAVNAARELRAYWAEDEKKTRADTRYRWRMIMGLTNKPDARQQGIYYNQDEVVILERHKHPEHGRFIYRPLLHDTSGDYDAFYDGEFFLKGKEVPGGYTVASEKPYLMVGRQLRLFQAPRLLAAIADLPDIPQPPIYAHIGVPGAGKTYKIIHGCEDGDLILAGCRKSIEDAVAELHATRPGLNVDARTADSYLINKRTKHRRVWLDERYALHAGYLSLIAAYTQCEELHTFGDPKQIPCYSRVPGFPFHFNHLPNTHEIYEAVSKRVPLDVARILAPIYTSYGAMRTMNPTRDSVHFKKIGSILEVPVRDDVQYLTWSHDDKKTIIKHRGFSNIKTIGESQGITKKHIVVIRLTTKTTKLYEKKEQAIVAISRHTRSFSYYSTIASGADVLYQMLTRPHRGRLDSFAADKVFGSDWDDPDSKCPPRAGGAPLRVPVLVKPPVCYRPNAEGLRDLYYKENLHLPHNARRYKSLTWADRPTPTVKFHRAPAPPVSGPLQALQKAYATAMEMPESFNEKYHSYLIERGDFSTDIPNSRVSFGRHKNTILCNEQLNTFSRLRTLQPWPRPSTRRQLLLALQKRNCNVGRYAGPCDPYEQAEGIVEVFFDTYCLPTWRVDTATYMASPVAISQEAMDNYLISADAAKLRALRESRLKRDTPAHFGLSLSDLDHYNVMFRKEPKNRLDKDALGEYQILQTVIHHDTKVNIICSFFRQLFDRLQKILKPQVFVQLKKSIDDLQAHLNAHVPPNAEGFENDFAKFDKSQLEETFAVEMGIYKLLGLDLTLLEMWAFGSTIKTAFNFLLGIRVQLLFQRTSGTVVTAFGNVLINMAAVAWAYKLNELKYFAVYFVGDDSFVFPYSFPDLYSVTVDLELFLNLQAKVIVGKGNYFCSCFFVHNGNHWVVLPDPVKRIERLSYPFRHENPTDLSDRWLSFKDMCKGYYDACAIQALTKQCALRYPGAQVSMAAAAIVAIMEDFQLFRALYYTNSPDPRVRRCYPL